MCTLRRTILRYLFSLYELFKPIVPCQLTQISCKKADAYFAEKIQRYSYLNEDVIEENAEVGLVITVSLHTGFHYQRLT